MSKGNRNESTEKATAQTGPDASAEAELGSADTDFRPPFSAKPETGEDEPKVKKEIYPAPEIGDMVFYRAGSKMFMAHVVGGISAKQEVTLVYWDPAVAGRPQQLKAIRGLDNGQWWHDREELKVVLGHDSASLRARQVGV